jgi:D-sedoheptulose 7-phosphate isomerase
VQNRIKELISGSIQTKEKMFEPAQLQVLEDISRKVIDAYRAGKKVLVFGNGGSAADAQHFTTELVCRFQKNRAALPALALTTNTSLITATGNDFHFDDIFSRQIEAWAAKGDVVFGISTSGNSPNVLKGIEEARNRGAITIGFTGQKQAKLKDIADLCYCAPSTITARIQECHLLAIHIISALVEEELFGA